ncbi:MAG TPA: DGQHR domain-containing protein [Candidatus Thermoplasmatota archaeon]|nr:DGQHR domain-containing protein [Candidatus Thermoplasmatota archaeon]
MQAAGFRAQAKPPIWVASIPGKWLLQHTTPSWRIQDPIKGFNRVVKEKRAKEIAVAVLAQGRTFPNAIVLATDMAAPDGGGPTLDLPETARFLVIDGQHRMWAQNFSNFEAPYTCVIHFGLTEAKMAELFLEINDTQRRVPSSLRWDLFRLVRPDDDLDSIAATELLYDLVSSEETPLYQRVDLTGENPLLRLKQGSIAPEIRALVAGRTGALKALSYEARYDGLLHFFEGLRDVDSDEWADGTSPFLRNRILRATIRNFNEIVQTVGKEADKISAEEFGRYLRKIKRKNLTQEKLASIQGAAGIKAIYDLIHADIFGEK